MKWRRLALRARNKTANNNNNDDDDDDDERRRRRRRRRTTTTTEPSRISNAMAKGRVVWLVGSLLDDLGGSFTAQHNVLVKRRRDGVVASPF